MQAYYAFGSTGVILGPLIVSGHRRVFPTSGSSLHFNCLPNSTLRIESHRVVRRCPAGVLKYCQQTHRFIAVLWSQVSATVGIMKIIKRSVVEPLQQLSELSESTEYNHSPFTRPSTESISASSSGQFGSL